MSQYGFTLPEPIHPVDNPAFFTAHSDPEEVYGNKNPEKSDKDNRNLRRRVENQAAAILHLPDPTLQTHLSDIHIRNRTSPIGSPITPDLGKTLTRVSDKCGRIAEQTGIKIDCSEDDDQQMQNDFSSSIDQEETSISRSSSSSSSSFHLNPHSETMEVGDPEDRFLFSLLTRQSSGSTEDHSPLSLLARQSSGSTEDRSPFSLLERQSSGSIDSRSSEMRDSARLVRSSSTLPFEDRSSSQSLLPLRTDALEFSNHTSYTSLSISNIKAVAHCLMQEERQGGVQVTDQQIEDCCRQNGLQVNAAYVKELLPKAREHRGFYVSSLYMSYFEDVTKDKFTSSVQNPHPKPASPPKEPTPPKTDSSVHSNLSQSAPTEDPIEEEYISAEEDDEYIDAAVEYFTEKHKNEKLTITDVAKTKKVNYKILARHISNTMCLSKNKRIKDYKKQTKAIVNALKQAKIPIEIKTNQVTLESLQTAFAAFHNEQPIAQDVTNTSLHPSSFSTYKTAVIACLKKEKEKNRELSPDEISQCCRQGARSIANSDIVKELLPEARKYMHIYEPSLERSGRQVTTLESLQTAFAVFHNKQPTEQQGVKITPLNPSTFSTYKTAIMRCLEEEKKKNRELSPREIIQHCRLDKTRTANADFVKELLPEARKYRTIYEAKSKRPKILFKDLQTAFAASHNKQPIKQAVTNTSLNPITFQNYRRAIRLCLQEEKKKNRQLSPDEISQHCQWQGKRKVNSDFVTELLPEARKYMTAIYEPLFERSERQVTTTLENLQTAFAVFRDGGTVEHAAKTTSLNLSTFWVYRTAIKRCLEEEKKKNRELSPDEIRQCCRWGDRRNANPSFVQELLPEARKYRDIYVSSFEETSTNSTSTRTKANREFLTDVHRPEMNQYGFNALGIARLLGDHEFNKNHSITRLSSQEPIAKKQKMTLDCSEGHDEQLQSQDSHEDVSDDDKDDFFSSISIDQERTTISHPSSSSSSSFHSNPLSETSRNYLNNLAHTGHLLLDDIEEHSPLAGSAEHVYRNGLKNREFDKELPQNFDPERATIAHEQGASEDHNFEGKLTPSKTDSSVFFGTMSEQCEAQVSKMQGATESVATYESASYNAAVTLPTQQLILSPATSTITVFFPDSLATGFKKKSIKPPSQITVADLQKAFAAFHDGRTPTDAIENTSLGPSTFSNYKTTITRCLEEEKEKNRELSPREIGQHCLWGDQQRTNPSFVQELLPKARKYMTAIYEPLFKRTHSSSSSSTHSHSSLLSETPQHYLNNLVHTGRAPENIATHESVLPADAGKKRMKNQPRTTVANLQTAFYAIHHGQNVKDAARTARISYADLSRYITAVANCLKQEKDQGAQLTNEQLQQCCEWNDLIQVDLDFVKQLLPEARKYKETIYISSLEDLHRYKETIYISSLEDLHRNNLKNQEFDRQSLQNSDLEQVDTVQGQDASKNQNFEKEPIPPQTDSSVGLTHLAKNLTKNTEEYISAAVEYLCNKKQLKNLSIEKVATNKNLKFSKLKHFISNAKLVLQNKPCDRYPREVAAIVKRCREIAQERKISIAQLIVKGEKSRSNKTSLKDLQTAFAALHNNQPLRQALKNTSLKQPTLSLYKKVVTLCLQEEKEKNRELLPGEIGQHCRWDNQQKAKPDFVKELLPEARKYMHIYEPSFTPIRATSTSSVQNAPEVTEGSQNKSKKQK